MPAVRNKTTKNYDAKSCLNCVRSKRSSYKLVQTVYRFKSTLTGDDNDNTGKLFHVEEKGIELGNVNNYTSSGYIL